MKAAKFQRAAGEALVARMVARICGVPGSDRWREVAERVSDSDASHFIPWAVTEMRLYPWVVDVATSVTKCAKKDQLIIDLLSDLGTVFVVKDEGGIWLMVADDAGSGDNNAGYAVASAPVMMFVNHAMYPENTYTITAIQLLSCLRQQ